MNLKKLTIICSLLICCSLLSSGFTFFKWGKTSEDLSAVNSAVKDYSDSKDKLWCVTFQLVWNEFMDKFADGKSIVFEGRNPKVAKQLNKRLYTKEILKPESYYLAQGEISQQLKIDIESAIKEKFNEKSDVLALINWGAKNSYLFYAMLKKDFTYPNKFEKLDAGIFNDSREKVKYFGVEKGAPVKSRNGVDVLFYNSPNEYAVKLQTLQGEDVLLLMTNKKGSFEKLYDYMIAKADVEPLGRLDSLKIPEISVDEIISYDELTGKKLKDKDYVITQALQTIKFKLDDEGGSLKSEAVISVMNTALRPESPTREFLFNKPFVLFLKESSSDKPYYAMKVDNIDYLVRE